MIVVDRRAKARSDLQRLLLNEAASAIKTNETPTSAERQIAFLFIQPLLTLIRRKRSIQRHFPAIADRLRKN
jgi:hypothetical protein